MTGCKSSLDKYCWQLRRAIKPNPISFDCKMVSPICCCEEEKITVLFIVYIFRERSAIDRPSVSFSSSFYVRVAFIYTYHTYVSFITPHNFSPKQ